MWAVILVVAAALAGAVAPAAQGPTLTVAQLFNPEDMSPWNYSTLATVDLWELGSEFTPS